MRHEGAQNVSQRATIPSEPAGVGTAVLWPRCDEPERLLHVGWSN